MNDRSDISNKLHATQPGGVDRMAVLADLGQEFARSIDIDRTLNYAVERIADYMQAEAASVFLVDATGTLECRACAGPVDVTGIKLSMGQGIVGRAAMENACQLIRDVANDPDFAHRVDSDTGFATRSMVCAPLAAADGVIGVLQVLNRRRGGLFDERDRETLKMLAAPTTLAINNARMASDLVEQQQIKKEIYLARRIQRSLLPGRNRSLPILGINLPARQVSGDFYDFFELDDGRLAFTVGDVSGKGINAALLMVRATSLLRWIGKSGLPPGEWLAEVNNELCGRVTDGMFVCAAAGYLDRETGTVEMANAGFPSPLLIGPTGSTQQFPAAAPPLAIIPLATIAQDRFQLDGGRLYLYSDGVSEIRDETGEMLGDDGFQALIDKYSGRRAGAHLGAIIRRLRRLKLIDDTTILMIDGAD